MGFTHEYLNLFNGSNIYSAYRRSNKVGSHSGMHSGRSKESLGAGKFARYVLIIGFIESGAFWPSHKTLLMLKAFGIIYINIEWSKKALDFNLLYLKNHKLKMSKTLYE